MDKFEKGKWWRNGEGQNLQTDKLTATRYVINQLIDKTHEPCVVLHPPLPEEVPEGNVEELEDEKTRSEQHSETLSLWFFLLPLRSEYLLVLMMPISHTLVSDTGLFFLWGQKPVIKWAACKKFDEGDKH